MYYKFLIISLHVSITLAISNSSISSVELINVQNATYSEPDGAVKFENSVAADEHESNFKWLVCSTFPGICSRLASFTRRLFHFGKFFYSIEDLKIFAFLIGRWGGGGGGSTLKFEPSVFKILMGHGGKPDNRRKILYQVHLRCY